MKKFSVVLTDEIHQKLCAHLIRKDGQEDLCFATYAPSTASDRITGIVNRLILPEDGERAVHGNASFNSSYVERCLKIARQRKEGLVFLHSHPYPGWQGMSHDDVVAESTMAPSVQSMTSEPLLGMTIGSDGAWSARFWIKGQIG